MRETYACSRGQRGEAKLDYFGSAGRVRGDLWYLTSLPDKIRFDVVSPFGATLSTLTSDGERFALFDLRQKTFAQRRERLQPLSLRGIAHAPARARAALAW